MRLLLTRPKLDARRTAATLRAKGHDVVIAPLLHIEAIADAPIGPGPWAAILVTSANAASALEAHAGSARLRDVPVFAVGQRSAHAARAAGFADVNSADGDVNDLACLVAARLKPPARLLYVAGAHRSGDLAAPLRAQAFVVDTVEVYRAVAAEKLPAEAADALAAGIDGVLHFSRRSAEAYVNAARQANMLASALRPIHFCLSAQIAEPLARAGAADIRLAPQPTEVDLLELVSQA